MVKNLWHRYEKVSNVQKDIWLGTKFMIRANRIWLKYYNTLKLATWLRYEIFDQIIKVEKL